MVSFAEAAREEFIMFILLHATEHTNLSRLYQVLSNGQFHMEARKEFVAQHSETYEQHKSYVDTFTGIAAKFDYGVETQPMLSIGIQHKDALYICRKIAKAFESDFTLSTYDPFASTNTLEEGEIEDALIADIKGMQSNTFLIDAFSYVHIAAVSK